MRLLTGTFVVAWLATQGFAAESPPAAKKQTTRSKTVKRPSKKGSASTVSKVASTATSSKTARTSKSKKRPAAPAPRRSAQQQPTSGRYKEIQQALTDKGYFSGSPDGNWGLESVEALRRFQRDQNLTDDGKIGSLSLIALGLGPQRVAAAGQPKPAQ